MRRLSHLLFISIIFSLLVSCGDSGTDTEEPIPHDFTTAASDELSQIIEETPSDFTWNHFNDNIVITLHDDPQWSGELVISGFQIQNGEVVNNMTSGAVQTNADELANGLSTEELFSEESWFSGQEWVSTEEMDPGEIWFPGEMWTPSEMEEVALSQNELSDNQTMVVVYAHVPLESVEREQVTRPFGIIFQQKDQAATGNLEVITTTNIGSDDNGYTLLVDGGNETSMNNADTTLISGLREGSHQVELTDIASGCSLNGENPRNVNITSGETTGTAFEINCVGEYANKIVFMSWRDDSREIYMMNADGTGKERMTNNPRFSDRYPIISNDGSKIAFTSTREEFRVSGNGEVYLMDIDGSNVEQLLYTEGQPGFYSWSPDDSRMAFSDNRNGNEDIFIVNISTGDVTQLTDNSAEDFYPSWSPSGDQIAFTSDRGGNEEIYIMDSDGNNVELLVAGSTTDQSSSIISSPSWSPDGTKIAYSKAVGYSEQGKEDEEPNIYVIDVSSEETQKITGSDNFDLVPRWSADGTAIVFERIETETGYRNIFKTSVDPDGPVERLTDIPEADRFPFWSPVSDS